MVFALLPLLRKSLLLDGIAVTADEEAFTLPHPYYTPYITTTGTTVATTTITTSTGAGQPTASNSDGGGRVMRSYTNDTYNYQENQNYDLYKRYQSTQSHTSSTGHNSDPSSNTTSLPTVEKIKIFPKLYLARYEQVPAIADAVKTLYNTIYPTIDIQNMYVITCQRSIYEYIIPILSSRIWQDRVSACLALESLLPAADYTILCSSNTTTTTTTTNTTTSSATTTTTAATTTTNSKNNSNNTSTANNSTNNNNNSSTQLSYLWDSGFILLDDIYENVRKHALSYMRILSDTIITHCNPLLYSDTIVQYNLSFLVQKLLTTGLISPCIEAKGLSFSILIKLVKIAKNALKAYGSYLLL